jgi:hypothetical protein
VAGQGISSLPEAKAAATSAAVGWLRMPGTSDSDITPISCRRSAVWRPRGEGDGRAAIRRCARTEQGALFLRDCTGPEYLNFRLGQDSSSSCKPTKPKKFRRNRRIVNGRERRLWVHRRIDSVAKGRPLLRSCRDFSDELALRSHSPGHCILGSPLGRQPTRSYMQPVRQRCRTFASGACGRRHCRNAVLFSSKRDCQLLWQSSGAKNSVRARVTTPFILERANLLERQGRKAMDLKP